MSPEPSGMPNRSHINGKAGIPPKPKNSNSPIYISLAIS